MYLFDNGDAPGYGKPWQITGTHWASNIHVSRIASNNLTTKNQYSSTYNMITGVSGETLEKTAPSIEKYDSTGLYTGTTSNPYGVSFSVSGEFIKIYLPSYLKLQTFKMAGSGNSHSIKNFYLLGSNDDSSWNYIYNGILTTTSGAIQTFNVNSTIGYKVFKVVINSTYAFSAATIYRGGIDFIGKIYS